MCFSAIIQQRAKKLGVLFHARIQTEDYADLFQRRLDGEKLVIGRGLEADFIENPQTEAEKRIRDCVVKWHQRESERLRSEIAKQTARRDEAIAKLQVKTTKKAETDLRVSTQKISKMTADLARHEENAAPTESDDRIYPRSFASMVCVNDQGDRIVRPVRYLMRPHDKDEDFDLKFHGCYNARRDALYSVPWWRNALGRRHGLICVRRFFEFVETPAEKGESAGSTEVRFTPEDDEWLLVPTLWDVWSDRDGRTLYSAALITDNPLPDVLREGHDRTPIFLTAQAAEEWLEVSSDDPSRINEILDQKTNPRLRAQRRGAAAETA